MANRTYNSGYSAGVAPTGLWRAIVKSVDNEKHISITIPKLSNDIVYTQVAFTGSAPNVGDEVYVSSADGSSRALVAITSPDVVIPDPVDLSEPFLPISSQKSKFTIKNTQSGERPILTSQGQLHWFPAPATGPWWLNILASGDQTLGDVLDVNEYISLTVMSANGGTPYTPLYVQIDGQDFNVTVLWEGGLPPTSKVNTTDVYYLKILKTSDFPLDEYTVIITTTYIS